MTDHSEQRPLSLKKGSTVTLQYYYVFYIFLVGVYSFHVVLYMFGLSLTLEIPTLVYNLNAPLAVAHKHVTNGS